MVSFKTKDCIKHCYETVTVTLNCFVTNLYIYLYKVILVILFNLLGKKKKKKKELPEIIS